MVTVYSTHLIDSQEDMNEEIASYKHINTQSKEVLSKTFSHLLSTIDYNFSSMLQEKIEIEDERKKLFEVSHTLGRCEDDLKVSTGRIQKNLDGFFVKEKNYSLKVEKLSSELITVNSLYNQLLGKVDVLESLENKK